MRLFRRAGARSSDASDTPSAQDPQLTALRFDTQTPLFNESVDNNLSKIETFDSTPRSEEDHIKQLQQIFKPPTNSDFSTTVARSVSSSPKISAMPKSKVAGGKNIQLTYIRKSIRNDLQRKEVFSRQRKTLSLLVFMIH